LLLYINIIYGKNITLNAIAFAINLTDDHYTVLIDEFNNYAIENDINIRISLNLFEYSDKYDTFGTLVEALLMKKTKKYDLFFYDSSYTQKYGKHLLDLNKYLPKEHIEMYNKKIISESCMYKDKLIGIPYRVSYSFLYSNDHLLTKYNKTVPKTWDELLDTSKYILERENNTDLVAYNGFFDRSEHGICSIYEFLYSCRNSVDSPIPDFKSKEAIDALKLIKKIKEEVGSDDTFKSDFNYAVNLLLEQKGLFVKIWNLPTFMLSLIPYRESLLPGIKEGISATAIVGYNLGINGYIPEEKLEAAIIALKFLTSKEMQKKYLTPDNMVTAITSLYDEVEVCQQMDCEIYKSVQPISRPSSEMYSITEYYFKIIDYFQQFLFGTQTAEKTMENIDNLTSFHYISFLTKESRLCSLVFLVIILLLLLIMISSLFLLYSEKYKVYFYYMTEDLWIISIIGLILVLGSCLTLLGPVTSFKCQSYISLLMLGYTLNLVPILYVFIINFPERIKVSEWVFYHKYIFLSLFLICDVLLIMLHSFETYKIKDIIVNDDKNFKVCIMNHTYGFIVITGTLVMFYAVVLVMLLLCYIEWNNKSIIHDVRFIIIGIYSDIISITLLYSINFFTIFNYKFYYIIVNALILVSTITSYIFIYLIRVLYKFIEKKKDDEVELYINTVFNLGKNKQSQGIYSSNICIDSSRNNGNTESNLNKTIDTYGKANVPSSQSQYSSSSKSLIGRIVNYHNYRNNTFLPYVQNSYSKNFSASNIKSGEKSNTTGNIA